MGLLSLPLHAPASERRGNLSTARFLAQFSLTPIAYLILPNLPLLLFRHKLTLVPHGVINIECLLIGIASLFLPRSLVFLLLIFDVAGVFCYEVCCSFQLRFVDLFTAMQSTGDLPTVRKEQIAVVAALVFALAALIAFVVPRPPQRWRAAAILAGLIVLLSAVDIWNGQNPLLHSGDQMAWQRLTLSPWAAIGVRDFIATPPASVARRRDSMPMPSATSAMMAMLRDQAGTAKPDVVVVLVESWGLMTDPRLADTLTAPYTDPAIASAYHLRYGTVPFDGMTVPGEVRELCQTHLGFGVLHVSKDQSEKCLPEQFEADGYRTYAVHGYARSMFQRIDWYNKLGFDETWFSPKLTQAGLPGCPGAFPGVCDPSIATWIGNKLLAHPSAQPRFVYWVTLNSHVPLPVDPELPADGLCTSRPLLAESPPLCSWFRIIYALHASVAQAAVTAKARPTVFVLVGDHAPPFSNPALRQNFSPDVVPWIMLVPNALQHAAPLRRPMLRKQPFHHEPQTISRVESALGHGR